MQIIYSKIKLEHYINTSGIKNRKKAGIICILITCKLRTIGRHLGFKYEGGCPCLVAVYKCKEYPAAKNTRTNNKPPIFEQTNIREEIKAISLNKFNVGGAAMLHKHKTSQSIEKTGNKFNKPLVKKNLRVEVLSYLIFAAANNPEEDNPCAIIIIKAPLHPINELVIIPAVINPIWATDL